MFSAILVLCATAACVSAVNYTPAEKAVYQLDSRAAFYGGWAIASTNCPTNTTKCDGYGLGGQCCPSNTVCIRAPFGQAVCCPDTNDCHNEASSVPVCADSSWTLYHGINYYFCCAPGQVGVIPGNSEGSAGLCLANDVPVPQTKLATLYSSGFVAKSTSRSSQTTPVTSALSTSAVSSTTLPATLPTSSTGTGTASAAAAGSTNPTTTGNGGAVATRLAGNASARSAGISVAGLALGLFVVLVTV